MHKFELSQFALIALRPFPLKFLIQSLQIDAKILRRNQQVFEPNGPHDSDLLISSFQVLKRYLKANMMSREQGACTRLRWLRSLAWVKWRPCL